MLGKLPLNYLTRENKMNATAAISAYSSIKNQTLSTEDVGYNVVSTALHKLETNLHLLYTSEKKKERANAFEQTLLTIYFLQKSLKFSTDDDLAANLFRLYEFCRIKVIEKGIAGSHNDDEINQCHSFVLEIVKSWDTLQVE